MDNPQIPSGKSIYIEVPCKLLFNESDGFIIHKTHNIVKCAHWYTVIDFSGRVDP